MSLIEVTIPCARCGETFTYEKEEGKRGRPRRLCDACKIVHAPRGETNVPHEFHLHLSDQDREKLEYIIEKMGSGRIDAIRTCIRIYHALLITQRR